MRFLYVLICVLLCNSCNTVRIKGVATNVLENEIVLLKSAPGGSRAHIMILSKNGSLKYCIGATKDLSSFKIDSVVKDKNYRERAFLLKNEEMLKINELIISNGIAFSDSTSIRDSWEYYVYVNGKKIAFGHEKNLNNFPQALRELIALVLHKTGRLYKLPTLA
jgi:hypothetical protein